MFALISIVSLASVVRAADWAMYRGDAQHSGASAEELPSELKLVWSKALPPLEAAWPDQPRMQFDALYQPIVLDRIMLLASAREDCVTAYRLEDGAELWRFVGGGPFRLPPAAANGKVYAGSDDGYLYALDLKTGKMLWKVKGSPKDRLVLGNERLIDTWPVRGGPVVAEGKVYFAAGLFPFMGIFVYCLDAESGAVVWCNSSDGSAYLTQPHGAKSFAGIAPQGAMTLCGEHLLIPNGRAVCASYERSTGKMEYFSFASKFGGHDVTAYNSEFFFNGGLTYTVSNGKAAGTALLTPVIAGGYAYGITSAPKAAEVAAAKEPSAPSDPVIKDPLSAAATAVKESVTAIVKKDVAIDGIVAQDLATPLEDPSVLKKLKGPVARFKTSAVVPFKGAKTLLAAGKSLYVGTTDGITVFSLPLSNKQAPSRKIDVKGGVANLIAADGKLIAVTAKGEVLCFGTGKPVEERALVAASTPDAAVPAEISALIADAGIKSGYALVLGAESLPAAHALISKTEMSVVLLEADAAKCEALRRDLLRAGKYGDRLAVMEGSLTTRALPSYFADLIVGADASAIAGGGQFWVNAFRVLHPYHGAAYIKSSENNASVMKDALTQFVEHAALSKRGDFTRLLRTGGVPGAGNWTHEHADAGNTRVSQDKVVKAPLGVLWWGGSSHDGILPRHGHGPQPQVVDGRLIIEGVDVMRAVDIYTGRVIWEVPLPGVGSYYNHLIHHPGANGTGTNFISSSDGIYVSMGRKCYLLSLDTGKTLKEFALPDRALAGGIWGYINVVDDFLIAGAGIPRKEKPPEKEPKVEGKEDEDTVDPNAIPKEIAYPRTIASKELYVFDRKTGKELWSTVAEQEFRHNGICAGGGKIFAVDRLTPEVIIKAKVTPVSLPEGSVLQVFALPTGKKLWRCEQDVFGTWLSYSAAHDVLMEAGRRTRDSIFDEPKGMRAFNGSTGEILWQDPMALGPAMIRGKMVMKEKSACDLLTGKPVMIDDPITGVPQEWTWTRMYGCNTPACSEHLLTFRSGAAGFYDLSRNGGTGNFGGFRSSCTHNLVVAGGILCAPDYTRTCICSYQLQTSVALIPDADVEVWTYVGTSNDVKAPIHKLGVNLGGAGDRMDDDGTQWLEYPSTGGPSPKISLATEPAKPEIFSRHSMLVSGAKNWVTASGMLGLKSLTLGLNEKTEKSYTVRLYFAEPQEKKAGQRVMTLKLQGKAVLSNFDVAAEAGGANKSVMKEFKGIRASNSLKVELSAAAGETLLCGVEVVAEK